MPEDNPLPPVSNPPEPSPQLEPPIDFHIGEEYGTAKKNLPPAKIIGICIAIVAVIIAVAALLQRPKVSATGSIGEINAVEVTGQNSVLVAVNVSFKNNGEKSFWIHSMKVDIATPSQNYSDEAAPASDLDRYFQAFPSLKEHSLTPLKLDDEVKPGAETNGTMVVSFPVTMDGFNSRKSLTVTIWPDRQPLPLVLTK